jgi:hypothetical protein
MPTPIKHGRMRRLKWVGTKKNGKVIQMGNGLKDKRLKNEYSMPFSLRLNRLPVPKTSGLKRKPYLPGLQYGLAVAYRP